MSISLDEFRAKTRESEPGRERIQQLRTQIHEAVRATAVTGHADWDHYLEKVEGRIKAYEDMKAVEQAILCSPEMVNQDKIMATKLKIVTYESAKQALLEIIDLPRMMIEQGSDASEKLRSIDPPEAA